MKPNRWYNRWKISNLFLITWINSLIWTIFLKSIFKFEKFLATEELHQILSLCARFTTIYNLHFKYVAECYILILSYTMNANICICALMIKPIKTSTSKSLQTSLSHVLVYFFLHEPFYYFFISQFFKNNIEHFLKSPRWFIRRIYYLFFC